MKHSGLLRQKVIFLSNMSHDIRTPMNAIVGMTAIAMTNIDDKPQAENCLKKITMSSKHLLGLVNDVLDMSKIESGNMTLNIELVSMREVMEGIVSIIQPQIKAKDQHLEVSIHNVDTEDVYCDSVRLNQMLINLLSNAVKFTPDGGTIDIESEQGKGTQFHVTLDLEKAQCREEDMILPDWNMLVVDDDEMLCKSTVNSPSDIWALRLNGLLTAIRRLK